MFRFFFPRSSGTTTTQVSASDETVKNGDGTKNRDDSKEANDGIVTPREETPLLTENRRIDSPHVSFYQDDPSDMTWGRRIARHLSRFRWYSPRSGTNNSPPSLDAAWAYFEHVTLPRRFVSSTSTGHDVIRKAEVGEAEKPTRLYSVWGTPEKDLGDFGLGVGTWFVSCVYIFHVMS